MSSATKTVHLILTGASGYLGQHLLSHWIREGVIPQDPSIQFYITALYHKSGTFPDAVNTFYATCPKHPSIVELVVSKMDLTSKDQSYTKLLLDTPANESVIVVHAAALSSPRACQADPETARAINVPTKFLDAIFQGANTSVVALSTDQVYDGRQTPGSHYKEDETDGLKPVNVYGQTKLELENYLLHKKKQQPESMLVALRSSIILGPKAPIDPGGAHGTFLDFCKSRGAENEATTFYTNEYRTVVRVDTVIQIIAGFVAKSMSPLCSNLKIYNMGGPVRVNRMELAKAVFDKFGYDESLLIEAEQTSPMSPLDISMDSSLLIKDGILPQRKDAIETTVYLRELVDYVFDQQ